MWHGLLIIHKERGVTSHRVVAELRHLLKQTEIGHTGTLDPEATGVLVIGLGDATRSFQFLDESFKIYQAELILGQATDTQDATGQVIRENRDFQLDLKTIRQAIGELTGIVAQVPPMYSAVKYHGKKLYELARAGVEVKRAARTITIKEWTIETPKEVYNFLDRITSRITCSKGTYIRTLIHDLGEKLGCGAHMGDLIRIQSGPFLLQEASTLEEIKAYIEKGEFHKRLIPLSRALTHLETLAVADGDLSKVANGGKLSFNKYPLPVTPGVLAKIVDSEGYVRAVVRLEDAGEYCYWQPVKVFRNQA